MIERIFDWLSEQWALFLAWLPELWATLAESYHPFWDTLDILIVAAAVYWLMLLIRGTRAEQMTLGLLILVMVWLLSEQLDLPTLSLLLDNFLKWGVLIVIVIFQHDIRRGLARVGKGFFGGGRRQDPQAIEEIVRACQALAQRRVGALIVIEREVSLEEYMELGTPLDAELTRDLLIAVFLPYSPLHDGAVLVRESRIAASGCILPLAMRANLPATLGTRHRAALGVAEETDAVAIVVSEETGRISLVVGSEILGDLDGSRLRQELLRLLGQGSGEKGEGDPVLRDAVQLSRESG
ncbi:MAG: diadenylate cyclase CdaA [Myxococcota bacterium]